MPEPKLDASPASPVTGDDALIRESIGRTIARSSGIRTLSECDRLAEAMRAGCRQYVRDAERGAAPEANLLAP